MKSRMFRITCCLLAVLMLAGVALGCNQNPTGEPSGTTTSQSGTTTTADSGIGFKPAGMPIVETPVTLDVLTVRWGHMGDSFLENAFLVELAEKSNVVIQWQIESSNDWDEQKAILLASGTLPGVIIGNMVFNNSDYMNNLDYFLALNDYIEPYMPNFTKAAQETSEMLRLATFPDGNIYTLPAKMPGRPQCSVQPVINVAWLQRLNLEIPDNIDDLYNVLKAFKENDANGSGKTNDEIPYSSEGVDMNFLAPFGITDVEGSGMFIKDGRPLFSATSDEYKEGLKFVRKLYEEEIIDQEMFTQDWSMLLAKFQNPDVSTVGFSFQWVPDAVFGIWADEYETIRPIAGPDGKRYAPGNKNGLSFNRNEFAVTRFCEYPEVAVRWADEFYTNEASIQNFWGSIGVVIEAHADGTYSLNNPPEGISADSWYWESSLRDFGPSYVSPDFESRIKLNPESGDGLKLEINKLGRDYVVDSYPKVMFTIEEYEELPLLTTDINSYIETTRARWITGGGIDAEWDEYIAQLERMGLERLVEIYVAAYDRYMDAD